MVVLVIDQVFWTRETEAALNERGLAGLKEDEAQCTQQLKVMSCGTWNCNV